MWVMCDTWKAELHTGVETAITIHLPNGSMKRQETQAAHVFLKDIGSWHLWLRKSQFATLDPHRMSLLLWMVPNTHAHRSSSDWTQCIIKVTKRRSEIGKDGGGDPWVDRWEHLQGYDWNILYPPMYRTIKKQIK